ncbi:amidase [Actinomycetospora cinnamomea]|uniref:Amidase n=1 Tax=Actinomycetospora cinnamomea TaxID=663609 RepID=A0A2U1EYA6_9PSEU|nr:amidase family protein [Actinomycetospora cinnamomea]PVZ04908.1 amidase [Actinomycetospora cinnamomea]
MSDLHELSALETGAAIRRGDVSALEVVDAALERADRLGPGLGAFTVLTPERARDAARALDRAGVADGGPLAGVPTAIKDLTATAGVPTARGSVLNAGHVPVHDDDVVGLLRAAGTISIGKTAVPEFGLPCYTEPAGAPPAVTPWDRTRSAGGSSGGAAAAVAAGILPVAHGTDGGGSIRIPASVCGLVGLKTTRGRVPAGPAGGDPAGLSVHGPLARTVADAAAFLDAIGVPAPGEPFVPAPPPPGGYLAGLGHASGPRRIALAVDPPIDGAEVHPACRGAAEDTAAMLADLGHHVEPVAHRLPDDVVDAFLTLWAVLSLGDPVDPADEPRLQPLTRHLRARGREVAGAAAMAALHTVQTATRTLVAERAAYDAVLTPTVALPPRPIGWFTAGGDPADDFARQIAFTPWTAIANLTGEPAISLPTSWSDGLPIGVALRGRRGEEAVLLGLGAELEAARPWVGRRPPVV